MLRKYLRIRFSKGTSLLVPFLLFSVVFLIYLLNTKANLNTVKIKNCYDGDTCTTERLPSSWSGIIDSEGYYYWFTNGYPPTLKHKCDILAGQTGRACFIKTNEKAEIINKNIILVKNRYG